MPEPPLVAVVVVSFHPGQYFQETLESIGGLRYPNRKVVVVNVGNSDTVAELVASLLPEAELVGVQERVGYAEAANIGARAVLGEEDPQFLLFCHDDAAFAPTALAAMVEVAFASNAGIVTPKIVVWESPRQILSLGEDLDAAMRTAPLVEAGELDQGQHDEIKEVAVASGAALLVRTDLFEELGEFDPRFTMLCESTDLSIRARLAGARIVTAPHSRVRHRGVLTYSERRRRLSGRKLRFVQERGGLSHADRIGAERRGRIRAAAKIDSRFTRWRVLSVIMAEIVLEAVLYLITGRPQSAWNALKAPEVLWQERAETAEARTKIASDRVIAARTLFTSSLFSLRRVSTSLYSRGTIESPAPESSTDQQPVEHQRGVEQVAKWFAWIAVAVSLIGLHGVIFGSVNLVGSLGASGTSGTLFHIYFSGSGTSRLTPGAVAPTSDALYGVLALIFFGHVAPTITTLVIASVVIGPYLIYRVLAKDTSRAGALFGAGLYALLPGLAVDTRIASIGALLGYSIAPALVWATVVAVRAQRRSRRDKRRSGFVVGVVAALGFALSPQLGIAWFAFCAFEAVIYLLFGRRGAARRLGAALGYAAVVTIVINLPWLVALVVSHPGLSWLFTGQVLVPAGFWETTFGAGIISGWSVFLAALTTFFVLASLVVCQSERAARVAWRLAGAVVLLLAAAASVRGFFGGTPISSSAFESLGCVFLALGAGGAADIFASELPRRRLSWRHLSSGVLAAAVGVVLVGTVVSTLVVGNAIPAGFGSEYTIVSGLARVPATTLWLESSGPGLVRGVKLTNGLSFAVTGGGTPTLADVTDPPVSRGLSGVRRALVGAIDGDSVNFGAELGRLGVRNVVVLPGGGSNGFANLSVILARQLDISQLVYSSGLGVYRIPPQRAVAPPAPSEMPRELGIAVQVVGMIGSVLFALRRRWIRRRLKVPTTLVAEVNEVHQEVVL